VNSPKVLGLVPFPVLGVLPGHEELPLALEEGGGGEGEGIGLVVGQGGHGGKGGEGE